MKSPIGEVTIKYECKRSLELGGPVPQHNIRGAWKQQGVVTKSTSRQWRKEKVDVIVKIKREQGKTKSVRQKIAYISD